jgi:hypothetical protein
MQKVHRSNPYTTEGKFSLFMKNVFNHVNMNLRCQEYLQDGGHFQHLPDIKGRSIQLFCPRGSMICSGVHKRLIICKNSAIAKM